MIKESSFFLEYHPVPTIAHLDQVGLTPNQEWDGDWIVQYLPSSWTNCLDGGKLCDPSQYSETQLWKKSSIFARCEAGRMKG